MTLSDAVSFWGYDLGKSLMRYFSSDKSPNEGLTIAQTYAAGFFSAIPMSLVSAPFERVKVLLQAQGQKTLRQSKKYSGGFDVLRRLYRQGGIRSIYKGAALTFARDGPDSAAYFATYEYCKKRLTPKDIEGKNGSLSLLAVGISGATAGVVMIIPLFPIDIVKSRLQNAQEGKLAIQEIISELYKHGGLKGFYPGVGPALARAVPASAATTLGWELAHQALNKRVGRWEAPIKGRVCYGARIESKQVMYVAEDIQGNPPRNQIGRSSCVGRAQRSLSLASHF